MKARRAIGWFSVIVLPAMGILFLAVSLFGSFHGAIKDRILWAAFGLAEIGAGISLFMRTRKDRPKIEQHGN